MTHDAVEPRTENGGGPLSVIGSDDERGAGERALAQSIAEILAIQRRAHGSRTFAIGGTAMSFAQFRLALHLPSRGSMTVRQLARAAGMTPASASQAAESLEAIGVITRDRSTADRRALAVQLTEAGRESRAALQESFEERWDVLAQEFGDEELAGAARVLARACEMLESWGRAGDGAPG